MADRKDKMTNREDKMVATKSKMAAIRGVKVSKNKISTLELYNLV